MAELSTSFVDKYTTQSLAAADSMGVIDQSVAAVASTVVDVGTSLWNSVAVGLPKLLGVDTSEYSASTFDILDNVNSDWANFYRQNEGAVQTASFLGGMLVPAGLALKGMKMLQAGKIGMYPTMLLDSTQAARITDLTRAMDLAGPGTAEFAALRWNVLAGDAAQQVGQAVGMEVALLAVMNEHPYLEDYFKDWKSNFAISVAMGGVIGAGFGQIAIRKQLTEVLGPKASKVFSSIQEKTTVIPFEFAEIDKVQRMYANSAQIESLVADETLTPWNREVAKRVAAKWAGDAAELETKIAPALLSKDVSQEAKEVIRSLAKDDASFGGNTITQAVFSEKELLGLPSKLPFFARKADTFAEIALNTPELAALGEAARRGVATSLEVQKLLPNYKELMKQDFSVFKSPHFDLWIPANSVKPYIRAVDIGVTGFSPTNVIRVNPDAIDEILRREVSPAITDKAYLDALGSAHNVDNQSKIYLHSSDLPTMNAWIARMTFSEEHGIKTPFKFYLASEQKGKPVVDASAIVSKLNTMFNDGSHLQRGFAQYIWYNYTIGNLEGYVDDFIAASSRGGYPMKHRITDPSGVIYPHSFEPKDPSTDLPKIFDSPTDKMAQDFRSDFLTEVRGIIKDNTKTKYTAMNQESYKAGAKQIELSDLISHLATQKEEIARSLLKSGASFHEIATRINSSAAAVTEHFSTGRALKEIEGWRSYTNVDDISKVYLSDAGRMLKVTTNSTRAASLRFRNADMSAQLDQKTMLNANQEAMAASIADVGSPQMKALFATLEGDKKIISVMDAEVTNAVNQKAGTFFWASSDFTTRHMGQLGTIASTMGQDYIAHMNTAARELLTDLSASASAHASSQAGLNELIAIFNHLAGLSGWRGFNEQTGKLFQRVPGPKGDGAMFDKAISVPGLLNGEISSGAQGILVELQKVSEQMYLMKNTINRIQGFKDVDNIGLHIPTFNPNNKFVSYIIDTTTQDKDKKVRMLIGKSPEELASLEQRWRQENPARPGVDLVTKGQQEQYNFVKMRLDPVDMDFVDVNKFHSGASASALPVKDDTLVTTLIENLHNRVLHYSRQVQEMYLHETMSTLDMMSEVNRQFVKDQPIGVKSIGTHQPEDAARAVKNMILGNNQLGNYSSWQNFNNSFSSVVDYVSQKANRLMHSFVSEIDPKMPLGQKDWVKYTKELEGIGVTNPFKGYDEYLLHSKIINPTLNTTDASVSQLRLEAGSTQEYRKQLAQLRTDTVARAHGISHPTAEQLIATGNGLISTLALRMMETGQPLVNALSMPILVIPELMRNMPKTFLGNELTKEGVGVAFPFRVMTDGVRARFSNAFKPHLARWEAAGLRKSIVSEASQINELINAGGQGALGKINTLLNKEGGVIAKLSTLSDSMESETRTIAMSIGFMAARTAYPGISDAGADLFAKSFLNKVIGNYHAAQRPALFQGTAGVALGLFQTYMLTWGQSMYRSIEEGAGKVLATQMLIQAGLFGTSSLPGYDLFSKTIASHFSDKHYDLTTGTYRALPTAAAEFVTYGLPASMGVGLYSRGDLQPRIPIASQNSPYEQIALVNVVSQFYGATAHALTKVMDANGMSAKSRALLEGLSMQSLSRPIARIAEAFPLPNGSGDVSAVGSLSRQGNTVATSSQVWSIPGLFSRVLSSRSTEEQVARETDYMASFHSTLDTKNRKDTTESLKTAIRSGTLNDSGVLDTIAGEYLRTGTATGWQAAMNEAVATSAGGIDYKLEKRLKPDSPLQLMIKTNF